MFKISIVYLKVNSMFLQYCVYVKYIVSEIVVFFSNSFYKPVSLVSSKYFVCYIEILCPIYFVVDKMIVSNNRMMSHRLREDVNESK